MIEFMVLNMNCSRYADAITNVLHGLNSNAKIQADPVTKKRLGRHSCFKRYSFQSSGRSGISGNRQLKLTSSNGCPVVR